MQANIYMVFNKRSGDFKKIRIITDNQSLWTPLIRSMISGETIDVSYSKGISSCFKSRGDNKKSLREKASSYDRACGHKAVLVATIEI